MLIYYSGAGNSLCRRCDPEEALHPSGNLMLTRAECGSVRDCQLPRLKRIRRYRVEGKNGEPPCGVRSHFLDSGSFTLKTNAAKYAQEAGKSPWDYYDTDEFWQYVDGYAAFVKEHKVAIDLYANVDAIPDPDITWRNQRYLEKKHGLDPVPVVHHGTDLDWLKHYAKRDRHEVIALGGLVGTPNASDWLDEVFTWACPPPSYKPVVKLHGFGMTSFRMMLRYPWWSVDSASWTKIGAYGGVLVPHEREGRFVFDEDPYVLWFSEDTPNASLAGKHYNSLRKGERAIIRRWLEEINVPLGDENTTGVTNHHSERKIANLLFFERWLTAMRPHDQYPPPFRKPLKRRGLGVL